MVADTGSSGLRSHGYATPSHTACLSATGYAVAAGIVQRASRARAGLASSEHRSTSQHSRYGSQKASSDRPPHRLSTRTLGHGHSSRVQGQSRPDVRNPRLFALVAVAQGHAKPFDVPGGYRGSQTEPCGPEGHGLPKSRAIEFVCPDQFAECLGTLGGVYFKVCP